MACFLVSLSARGVRSLSGAAPLIALADRTANVDTSFLAGCPAGPSVFLLNGVAPGKANCLIRDSEPVPACLLTDGQRTHQDSRPLKYLNPIPPGVPHMAAQDTPAAGDVIVVRIPGPRAVQTGVPAFHDQLAPHLEQSVPRIVLDMADVEFVDSAYLGAMVMGLKRAVARQGDLKLCSLHKQVEKLFHKLRLSRVFDVHETEEGARNAFSAPRPSS